MNIRKINQNITLFHNGNMKSDKKTRFNLTKSGKVKRARAYKSHILTKKDTKRTRRLRTTAYADVTNTATVKKLIPYK